MSDPLSVVVLKRDVQTQMSASREVLEVAQLLQRIAEGEPDEARKNELRQAVSRLAATGSKIVQNARDVSQHVARAAGAMP
ncbi:hypothetical protein [Phaeospirillum tilakii]|uniref:Uncharacterized protein n=1 Tax=Phaeospirillum tilakii TaxID=741673 RepID=A0ABW5CF21_9PROT